MRKQKPTFAWYSILLKILDPFTGTVEFIAQELSLKITEFLYINLLLKHFKAVYYPHVRSWYSEVRLFRTY